jgi:uncharacterized protein
MKFHLADTAGLNAINGYGADHVLINGVRHDQPLLVMPAFGPAAWSAADFEHLSEADFDPILAQKPELVLIGTGARLRFPSPALTRRLAQARIGSEAMDTAAACRTYNILMGEGRLVLAALLFDSA